jgi:hypothetical protein
MSTFAFNFKAQFADLVQRGQKVQTIRKLRADSRFPFMGDKVRLYTALRTKSTRWLADGMVTRCRRVQFDLSGDKPLIVDAEALSSIERIVFARDDGFSSWLEMLFWFRDQYGNEGDFDGFSVQWIRTSWAGQSTPSSDASFAQISRSNTQ